MARKPNVIFLLPLSDKTFYEVTEQDVSHFTELYPAVSIEQTFRNIIGWLEANPTKRKTRRGVAKFVNGWLSREQDKPHNGENGNGYKKTGLASFFDEYAKTGSAVAD